MRIKNLVYLPVVLAGATVPVAAAATFAGVIGPEIVVTAYQPPEQSSAASPDARSDAGGAQPQAQVNSATDDPVTANSPTTPAMPNDPAYHGQPYVGALAAPSAQAMNRNYPSCSARVQDECRNRNGQ